MRFAAVLAVFGFLTIPVAAQGRGGPYGGGPQAVPPGQLPPPGSCRVWYDNRPPGRQPAPINCNEAERLASRDRSARVIYGPVIPNNSRSDRDSPYSYPGARYPNGGPSYGRGGSVYASVSFNNGYRDGYDKGREDAQRNRSYDPVRHDRYRTGDHDYNRRFGTKAEYKIGYRNGFESGYAEGYRSIRTYGGGRR